MLPVWSLMGNENWCMSGYHAVSVLADAITKGIFSNVDEALDAMVSTPTVPYYEGVADYMNWAISRWTKAVRQLPPRWNMRMMTGPSIRLP